MTDNIEMAKFNLERINAWIEFADKKAGFLLTLSLAFFSISLTMAPKTVELLRIYISQSDKTTIMLALLIICLIMIYLILSIYGIYKLIKVIEPKISSMSVRKSIFFYGDINDMQLYEFKNRFIQLPSSKFIGELCDQIHANSKIASSKYNDIHRSILLLKYAGLLGLFLIILINILYIDKGVLENYIYYDISL